MCGHTDQPPKYRGTAHSPAVTLATREETCLVSRTGREISAHNAAFSRAPGQHHLPGKGVSPPSLFCPAPEQVRQTQRTFFRTAQQRLTCPVQFDGPLVKEDKFAFAIVNGRLSVKFVHFCHLTLAFLILHPHCQEQCFQFFRGPV